jgi:hypothetical protein
MCHHSDSCRVSDKGVEQLYHMRQLVELRLGSSAEKVDGYNNTFTVNKFAAVIGALASLLKLTVLEIQLPHVKEFNIGGKGMHW